jgi:hypothetical protein
MVPEQTDADAAAISFSYSQLLVFDRSVARPGCAWTERHSLQGFARRESNVSFGTLLEFGHADVSVHSGAYRENDGDERVIEVPLEVVSGDVVVCGPEQFQGELVIRLKIGRYRLVAAQRVVAEDQEEIDLYFEEVDEALATSRILRADDGLRPRMPLLESSEVA